MKPKDIAEALQKGPSAKMLYEWEIAYSCKWMGNDKRLKAAFKAMIEQLYKEISDDR